MPILSRNAIKKFTGLPVEIFIAFLEEISNSKTFEAKLQNSSGRLVESYWTSSTQPTDVK